MLLFLLCTNNVYAQSEIKDFLGRDLKVNKHVSRILSLTPATTEILYKLGLEKKIVGVTEDCNYPSQAKQKPSVGKFGFINLEKIVSLKPDIIFATYDMKKQLDILKKYNVPLIALKTDNIDSIINNINLVGKITDSQKQASIIEKDFKNRINKVKEKSKSSKKPTVFYCIWHDPLITAGSQSFIGDMIKVSGGINIAYEIKSSFAKYSIESLVAKNPDYIVIPESTYKKINFNLSPWNRLKAIKNKNYFSVNDDLYLRPAPRIINAIEDLQKHILK